MNSATINKLETYWACSLVWLEHLAHNEVVQSSNLCRPTGARYHPKLPEWYHGYHCRSGFLSVTLPVLSITETALHSQTHVLCALIGTHSSEWSSGMTQHYAYAETDVQLIPHSSGLVV